MRKAYDIVLSLGSLCFCTDVLRKNDLQAYSYPFDWVAGASFEERSDILLNNFDNWLNVQDLEYIGRREHSGSCNIYENTKTNIIYNHDFKIDTPLEKTYPAVAEKYNRRIKRLFKILSKSRNVLVVYMDSVAQEEILADEKLISIREKLENKFKNAQIDVLYIHQSKNHQVTQVAKGIEKIFLDYKEYDTNQGTFVENINVLRDVLMDVYLKKYAFFRMRKIKKGLAIHIFRLVSTIFRLRLYLFGFRFDLCIGKARD